jgi:hypothetical protein
MYLMWCSIAVHALPPVEIQRETPNITRGGIQIQVSTEMSAKGGKKEQDNE